VFWSNGAVRAERDVFLAAAIAAIAATLDAANLSEDPSSRSNGRLLTAVRQMADLQEECLVAQDRLIQCYEQTGLDQEIYVRVAPNSRYACITRSLMSSNSPATRSSARRGGVFPILLTPI
jgi:hypothetical protein